jgi:hypothetical protein
MEKMYQVFISSTYEDLKEERQKVTENLLKINCFPVGMESFSASNDEQLTVIEKLIDKCDYYILILGGRYGSIEESSDKSYTQLEYEYAVEKKIPILSFYHKNPELLAQNKSETNPESRQKLQNFRKTIQKNKLCQAWSNPDNLALAVNISLTNAFKKSPRTGWVRPNDTPSSENSKEILLLEEENKKLNAEIKELKESKIKNTEEIAQGDDLFEIKYYREDIPIHGTNQDEFIPTLENFPYEKKQSWNEIFLYLAHKLEKKAYESELKMILLKKLGLNSGDKIDEESFQIILAQFQKLGLIIKSPRLDGDHYWGLSMNGEKKRINDLVQKK